MAELNVEPKKSSPWLWIIIVIIILIILFFLIRSCNNNGTRMQPTDTTMTSSNPPAASVETQPAGSVVAATGGWEGINYNAPQANYEEITNRNIDVRNDDRYTIYSLGQNVLFDVDKSTIRSNAEGNLRDIANSITKRYPNSQVRIYGFTDSTGSKDYNRQLAEQRAQTVQDALVRDGVNRANVSIEPMGESKPVADNSSQQGRQENRRVEVVVSRT